MYKVIIVDDETSVRERLFNLINKIKNSFEVVGVFENGYDALINGVSLNPDLIITDIKMPYINGIELIKLFKLELPFIQSVIISGYDSFDFAKQAISLGVIAYITKPITLEELNATMEKAKVEIDNKLLLNKDIKQLEENNDKALALIRDNDLSRLLTLHKIPSSFKDKLFQDKLNLDYKYLILGIFDNDEEVDKITFEDNEKVTFFLANYIKSELNDAKFEYIIFKNSFEYNIFLLSNDSFDKEDIESRFSRIIIKMKKATNISLSVGFSDVGGGINSETSFKRLYIHASRALEYRTIIGLNLVLFYDDIDKNQISTSKIDENEFKTIVYEILYGKVSKAKNDIHRLLNNITLEQFKSTYFLILNNLLDSLLKSCINLNLLFNDFMPNVEMIQKLINLKTLDSVIKYFDDLVDAIDKVNKQSIQSGVDNSFNKIKNFIEKNYKNSLLSLEDVANELGYSVSYISAILKKNNTSFTKYLTGVRMEKAKTLLANKDNKLIMISSEVGYEDPYYFSHCFKKYTGISPLEYRTNEKKESFN